MSRTERAAAETAGAPPAPAPRRTSIGAKLFLTVSALALLGWLALLSYTALTKSHSPVLSRSQAAVADVAVVAELGGEGDTPSASAVVKETLTAGDAPKPGVTITVKNLPACRKFDASAARSSGYRGPGLYLLLLRKIGDQYEVAAPGPSPGGEGSGLPLIYLWDDGVREQAKQLLPHAP